MFAFIPALLMFFQLVNPSKGNDAFEKGEYDKAISIYQEALEANPEESRLLFNIGNSLSKLGKGEESIKSFESFKEMVESPVAKALADYNIGSILAEQDPSKAIEAFQQALRANPEDEDAKHNLELLLRRQQENQEQQQQQNQDQDQNQDENQQDQNQQQQQQQNQQQQDQNSQQDQQQQDQSPSPDSQQSPQGQQTAKLSPKEAEALLDALGQREKDLLKAMKKLPEGEQTKSDKDW